MRRGYAAAVDGPITIDVGLFGHDGWVKVQVSPDCTRALVGISTLDDEGRSVAAVRDAVVESGPDDGLIVTLHGTRPSDSGCVEITVVAPPGSSLVARTDSAHIGAIGLADAELHTKSGNISVPTAGRLFVETTSGNVAIQRAAEVTVATHSGAITATTANRVTARTTSGDILLGAITGDVTAKSVSGRLATRDFQGASLRADNTSGSITIHASTSSTIRAATISGDITITAAPATALNLQTSTATGRVAAPGNS